MKLTLQTLIDSLGNVALGDDGAFARFNRNALPLKITMQMKGIIRRVEEIMTDYHKKRLALLDKFGELQPETDNYTFTPENRAAFDKAFRDLVLTEVDIAGTRLKPSQLLSSTVISPQDAIALEWLIDDGCPVAVPAEEIPAVAESAAPVASEADQEDPLELGKTEEANSATA